MWIGVQIIFLNSVDDRRGVSQSLGEWLYIVHCQKYQLSGWWSNFFLNALKFNLFDQNFQNKQNNSECNSVIDLFNLKMNNWADMIGLSKGHFIKTSLRQTQLCRMHHLVKIFRLVFDAKINHGKDAVFDTICVMYLSHDCGNCRR